MTISYKTSTHKHQTTLNLVIDTNKQESNPTHPLELEISHSGKHELTLDEFRQLDGLKDKNEQEIMVLWQNALKHRK